MASGNEGLRARRGPDAAAPARGRDQLGLPGGDPRHRLPAQHLVLPALAPDVHLLVRAHRPGGSNGARGRAGRRGRGVGAAVLELRRRGRSGPASGRVSRAPARERRRQPALHRAALAPDPARGAARPARDLVARRDARGLLRPGSRPRRDGWLRGTGHGQEPFRRGRQRRARRARDDTAQRRSRGGGRASGADGQPAHRRVRPDLLAAPLQRRQALGGVAGAAGSREPGGGGLVGRDVPLPRRGRERGLVERRHGGRPRGARVRI